MPRSRTPSRGRVAAATKKSPSRARSRSRSRGRPAGAVGASPGRLPGSTARRTAKSPARRPAPVAAVQEATAATVTARSPIRLTRSRSPARVMAPPVEPPAELRTAAVPVEAPVAPAPRPPPPEPVAAAAVTPAAQPVMLTSTPKTEVRGRRSISRQPPEVTNNTAPVVASRHSARIANKLRELGIDPSAGGDTSSADAEDAALESHVMKVTSSSVCWRRVLAAPLVLLSALLPYYLYSACNKKTCSIGRVPEVPRSARGYLDPASLLYVPSWLLLQLLLAKLPVGAVVEGQISKQGLRRHRCNGMLTLVATLCAASLALHLEVPLQTVLLRLRLLLVSTLLWALLFSLVLHLRSRRAHLLDLNSAGDTNSFMVNLVSGRELSPTLLGVDLKLLVSRSSTAALAMLTMLYVLSERQSVGGHASPTFLLAAGMIFSVALDRAWFEDNLLTTYMFMNEGLGLDVLLREMMLPFLALFNLRFITVTGTSQPWYALLGCGLLFAVGYLIQRSSNSQKNEFRKNPVNPALAHLETIPTTKGKKLLVSGWWSVVRHPNHLGGLLMVVAMSLLLGFHHALAWVQLSAVLVATVCRVRQLDRHCQHKYGAAWQRYAGRVRHGLVPALY